MHPIPAGKRPFATVHLDHLGPFVSSSRRNKYILAAICNFTKLFTVRDVKAKTTIRNLEKFVNRFGAPERFITDRGTSFTAEDFKKFCYDRGVKHTLNSSRYPQANGQVERLNQTILPALQTNLSDVEGRDWDKSIEKIERDLNTASSKTTGHTPFEMLYGYVPRFCDGLIRDLTVQSENYKIPTEIQNEVRETIEKKQQASKERYDQSRLKNIRYSVGDIVYMKCNPIATGESTKLQARNKGLFVVTEMLPSDTYRIQGLNAKGRFRVATTAHVSQLRIWRGACDESDKLGDDCISSDENIESDVDETQSIDEGSSAEVENTTQALSHDDVAINNTTERRIVRNRKKPSRFNDFEI